MPVPGVVGEPKTLGERIRRRRLQLRLLQRELGERLGVTESTVSNWECGRTEPAPFVRTRVHALLGDASRDGN
jgi:transcriptional regulator with XRE-family HTH domain